MKKSPNNKFIVSYPDGRTEGPLSLEEMKQRIAAGNITGSTILRRGDSGHWSTAAAHRELGVKDVALNGCEQPAAPGVATEEVKAAQSRRAIRCGAGWFVWIAAMSLLNTLCAGIGSGMGFAVGLSVVHLTSGMGAAEGSSGVLWALALNLSLSVLFLGIGAAGWRKRFTPYWIGIFLYAGDALLACLTGDWFSTGIHLVALYFLHQGLATLMEELDLEWGRGLLLRGALCMTVAAGGGWGLRAAIGPRPPAVVPEAWVSKPSAQWPQIVLTHAANFAECGELTGASAFLMRLPDGQIVGVTAKHLFAFSVARISSSIQSWEMHPRTKSSPSVHVTGLVGNPGCYGVFDDIVALRLSPVEPGEKVFIIGVPHGSDSSQEVYPASIVANADNILDGIAAQSVRFEGFSGAPLVDQNGYVVGVLTGPAGLFNSNKERGFSAHAITELADVLESSSRPDQPPRKRSKDVLCKGNEHPSWLVHALQTRVDTTEFHLILPPSNRSGKPDFAHRRS